MSIISISIVREGGKLGAQCRGNLQELSIEQVIEAFALFYNATDAVLRELCTALDRADKGTGQTLVSAIEDRRKQTVGRIAAGRIICDLGGEPNAH